MGTCFSKQLNMCFGKRNTELLYEPAIPFCLRTLSSLTQGQGYKHKVVTQCSKQYYSQ